MVLSCYLRLPCVSAQPCHGVTFTLFILFSRVRSVYCLFIFIGRVRPGYCLFVFVSRVPFLYGLLGANKQEFISPQAVLKFSELFPASGLQFGTPCLYDNALCCVSEL